MKMYDKRWLKLFAFLWLFYLSFIIQVDGRRTNVSLTACQHLRRVELRRAKALMYKSERSKLTVRVPRCNKEGDFESVQCMSEKSGQDCWCVDDYGYEIPGTRNVTKSIVRCNESNGCPASVCRMFCPAGFARDTQTGCTICQCRDPCSGIECPNGQNCHLQEVKCKSDPCPPVPTCKKARSLANFCPSGLPLAIDNSSRPFLCGFETNKPQCPPLYKCLIEQGNDYGVCCPNTFKFEKPGMCPSIDKEEYTSRTGYMCGTPCSNDLECENVEKCCYTKGCQYNCRAPQNLTTCHQARVLADILSISEREGRGYLPECDGPGGIFSPKQCSRNGLVCWCVDPRSGHKIQKTMGAANEVNCNISEIMVSRSLGRTLNTGQCDINICAAVCEYGFKNDHNGCPSCECSEPCEGFKCPIGFHCEVALDKLCETGSHYCSSWPVCKPDLLYSNPCDLGVPLSNNSTGEIIYCIEERKTRAYQPAAFFEPESEIKQSRSRNEYKFCPENFKCTRLHHDTKSVCCPKPDKNNRIDESHHRQQTMCEYLRDFSGRMEGTEAGMQLAIPAPTCKSDGLFRERQCSFRKIIVTRSEQRKILEHNTIRRMRMLLSSTPLPRSKRNAETLKLYRVDDNVLKIHVTPSITRSAKVIEVGAEREQGLGMLFDTDFKKVIPAPKRQYFENEIIEMDVEECWCVDSFGTEIPQSRGFNITDELCAKLRDEIHCLDLTCRMGCEYGFKIDPETRCPMCQCRDPCDGVTCGDGKECRIVDVSCDEEYCPPVPACLPRKPGQCPFLVPPGSENLDANTCAFECRTDFHCEGSKRCCSNGCGTQCVQPQMKTACQHLQAIQMHQASELGIPAMKMHIVQCNLTTGKWSEVQCIPEGYCWCVDESGQELSGTRILGDSPICKSNSAYHCPTRKCHSECEDGFQVDKNGCQTCNCRNYCDEINCSSDEECQLIIVECVDRPCPRMPICVPKRQSICPEGSPMKQNDLEISCGPHNENEICPTTHTCQLNPVNNRGVCCTKTRDVCFESIDNVCLSKRSSNRTATRYRFSPKANKCLPIDIDPDEQNCLTKNLFHNEFACTSVCPVLTQCERLKIKNSIAALRTGHTSVWFQPRCDPVTGNWSPVQCLGTQPTPKAQIIQKPLLNQTLVELSKKLSETSYGVCWCSDKKGAPLKGTLTRDAEPSCNSRQGRILNDADPILLEFITKIILLDDVEIPETTDNFEEKRLLIGTTEVPKVEKYEISALTTESGAIALGVTFETENVLEPTNSLLDSKLSVESIKPIRVNISRCRALARTAPFEISCDKEGGFFPTQCNDTFCWCVDAAGNQLDSFNVFPRGRKQCKKTLINSVIIDLYLRNKTESNIRNTYDVVRFELQHLLGNAVENLRVQENLDGSVVVRFELHNDNKIDLAFAIESAVIAGDFRLLSGKYTPDITRSHFVHKLVSKQASIHSPQSNSIHLLPFVIAASSALFFSAFILYAMVKRRRHKVVNTYGYPIYAPHKADVNTEKTIDLSAPIFILSANLDEESNKPVSNQII